MIAITLPDGSRREFDNPVTVGDVAASIGAGLAKAALAGKVDGKLVDTSFRIGHDASLEIVTDKHPDFIRGYGFQGASGSAEYPSMAATTPGFGASFKQAVRENYPALINYSGFGEVLARKENRVFLDPQVTDAWGIPVLKFEYTFSDNERKMAADMAVDFRGTGVATLSIWMGILLTERLRAAFAGQPEALAATAQHAETPEFTGHLIDAVFADPELAALSGQTVIGAELAQRYGITDAGGRTPPSHREMLGAPRAPSSVVLR